jgi:hypothetical protein
MSNINQTQGAGITAVATSLPSPELGAISWNAGTTEGPEVCESMLNHINMDQITVRPERTHFAMAALSTGGEAPVPTSVLWPKLGAPVSVTTYKYAGPGG